MHPINKTNFGTKGVKVSYYNGSSVVSGYIVKQLGVSKYLVTDGTNPRVCTLAQTSAQVSGIGSGSPTICTIPISMNVPTARGATFTATYALDATTTGNGGSGYTQGDSVTLSGGTRASGSVTIGASNAAANNTVTINDGSAHTVTFVASGATGAQVNIGGTPALTATALYNYLSANVNTNINYYVSGSTVGMYAKTDGTAGNAYTLATGGGATGANLSVSGATLTGGASAVAGTPSVVTVNVTGGGVTGVASVATPGSWTTLPSGTVVGYYATNGRAPATFTARFKVLSIAASGGSGYAVNDNLSFSGMTDGTAPVAHISAVSAGAPTTVVVDSAGSGITSAASGTIGVLGATEHARVLYDSLVQTVEGNRYYWALGQTINGSAVVNTYS